ncbi:MAG: hypothetical protein ACE5GA_06680, partial [Candidatus Zixiibacteriota bacterium]
MVFTKTLKTITILGAALALSGSVAAQTDSRVVVRSSSRPAPMPAELAGEIPAPSGRIAFIRSGDVYVINVDGSGAVLACAAGNAYGRLSWAPDNSEIAFARRGQVEIKAPDNLGGKRRVYDIFKVVMDSVGLNSDWWLRVTEDLGGRYPEWSQDGSTILFTNDYNAFLANPDFPNYQLALCDPDGGSMRPLRKDYQQAEYLSINPTAGPDGSYAFIAFFELKAQGLIIVDSTNLMPSFEEVRAQAKREWQAIAPSWSPDGKWIAYVHN